MLFSARVIEAVAAELSPGADCHWWWTRSWWRAREVGCCAPDAVEALVALVFPLATVVTPNLPEAQALTGLATEDRAALAERLVAMGACAALVTGGHGADPVDHLFDGRVHLPIPVIRHHVAATHGAGCTHSAALAAGLAAGFSLPDAARRAALVAAGTRWHTGFPA